MKKLITAITITVILVTGVGIYALADGDGSIPQWFTDMVQWKNKAIDKAVQDGTISAEDAERFKDRLVDMEEHHKENGFDIKNMFKGKRGGMRGPQLSLEEAEARFKEMMELKKADLKKALDGGKITQKGYDEYLRNLEERIEEGFEGRHFGPKGGFMNGGQRPNGCIFGAPENKEGNDL